MFAKSSSWWPVVFLSVALLVDGACSNSSSPTSPSTGSSNSTGSTNTNPGASRVTVTVNPNPVPFSGKPVTDVPGCEKRNNTWYYEQILEETAGVAVTFTTEVDAFDGFVVNSNSVKIDLSKNGKVTLNPRWCSATAEKHTAQSTFLGTDANGNPITVMGPTVNLMAPPKSLAPAAPATLLPGAIISY